MNPNTYIKKKDIKPSMKKFVLKPKNVMDFESWFEDLKPSDEVELRGKKYEEMILAKNIQSSNVLRNDVKYEIEIETLKLKFTNIESVSAELDKLIEKAERLEAKGDSFLDDKISKNTLGFDEQKFLIRRSRSNEWIETEMSVAIKNQYGIPYPSANALFIGIVNK